MLMDFRGRRGGRGRGDCTYTFNKEVVVTTVIIMVLLFKTSLNKDAIKVYLPRRDSCTFKILG